MEPKKKNFWVFPATPVPTWKPLEEPLESIIAALAKSLSMQLGHQNVNPESPKSPPEKDEQDIYAPAAVYCIKCGDADELTYEESYLWRMGLWPHRCEGCNELRYNGSFKELGEYMEGPE